MKNIFDILESEKAVDFFIKLYNTDKNLIKKQVERYKKNITNFEDCFNKNSDVHLFSTSGRTEIGGNHTDHNHGRVLAAGVNLDSIATATKTEDNVVTVYSENY